MLNPSSRQVAGKSQLARRLHHSSLFLLAKEFVLAVGFVNHRLRVTWVLIHWSCYSRFSAVTLMLCEKQDIMWKSQITSKQTLIMWLRVWCVLLTPTFPHNKNTFMTVGIAVKVAGVVKVPKLGAGTILGSSAGLGPDVNLGLLSSSGSTASFCRVPPGKKALPRHRRYHHQCTSRCLAPPFLGSSPPCSPALTSKGPITPQWLKSFNRE